MKSFKEILEEEEVNTLKNIKESKKSVYEVMSEAHKAGDPVLDLTVAIVDFVKGYYEEKNIKIESDFKKQASFISALFSALKTFQVAQNKFNNQINIKQKYENTN